MNEKQRKAVYSSIWTFFMAIACYLTIMPFSTTSTLNEISILLTIETVMLIMSLTVLTVAINLYKKHIFKP